MGALLVCLVLIVLLFGAGFALHMLWWVALVGVVIWLVGLAAHAPERRWYRW
jgi:hypothetical protein